MPLPAALHCQYSHLSVVSLPSCHDFIRHEGKSDQFYCVDLHPAHVDEFSAAHHGLADPAGENGVINQLLGFLHLPSIQLINTPYAIILGMVYNFLPFMVLPLYNVLSKIDKDVIFAARDLGATELYTFRKIIFPLSLPGVVSGVIMVFVPALTTFVISDLLGGSKILLIGNVIEQKFKQGSNWHVGSGLSLVLMVFILISMVVTTKYDKDGQGGMF